MLLLVYFDVEIPLLIALLVARKVSYNSITDRNSLLNESINQFNQSGIVFHTNLKN